MGVPWTEMDETRTNEYVADLTNRPKCALCQDAGVRIYKKDHCRRCYDLIRKEDRLKKKIRNLTGMTQGQAFEVKFDLSVTRKAIQLTKIEGEVFGNISQRSIDGLNIERQLSRISRLLIHKDLYYGSANTVDWHFTPAQKKLLYYLLSKLERAYNHRHSFSRAAVSYIRERAAKEDK